MKSFWKKVNDAYYSPLGSFGWVAFGVFCATNTVWVKIASMAIFVLVGANGMRKL